MKPEEIANLAISDIPMSRKIKLTANAANQKTHNVALDATQDETAMLKKTSNKKTSKKTAAANAKAAQAKTARKLAADANPKRVSALDAAATVLKKAGKPMRSQEMIAAMTEAGLWSSPNGKTPHATLYSAILREIGTKGKEARFRKVDRGQFEYAQ